MCPVFTALALVVARGENVKQSEANCRPCSGLEVEMFCVPESEQPAVLMDAPIEMMHVDGSRCSSGRKQLWSKCEASATS